MKKAIIVGATSGIGRALATILASNNYLVGVTGRRKNLLEELKSERPKNIAISDFDITNSFEATKKFDALVNELGGLDLLVLSAGIGDINEALDFILEKNTINTNVLGFTEIADWTFNYFQKQKSGHFVAITSIAGIRGSRQAPAYNATKAFQINYLEGLRQKAKKLSLPIFVTDIRPGFVDTAMAKGEAKFWISTLEKTSKQIYKAIENKKSVAYITKRWEIVALVLKFIPRRIYAQL